MGHQLLGCLQLVKKYFTKGNVFLFLTTNSDAFEYYFFHFAYFLVNPGMQKVNNNEPIIAQLLFYFNRHK